MGDRRLGWLLAAALLLFLAPMPALAGQDAPVYVTTGTDPDTSTPGACVGDRVWVGADDGQMYCCTGGTWETCGSVDTADYATSAGNASTADALSSNPGDCDPGEFATTIDASGNLTCATPAYTTDTSYPAAGTAGDLQVKAGSGSGFAAFTAKDCSAVAGGFATGINADGSLTCAVPNYTTDTDTSYPSTGTAVLQMGAAGGDFAAYGGTTNCNIGEKMIGLNADGTADCYADVDTTLNFGNVTPSNYSITSSNGTSGDAARADHEHGFKVPDFGPGSLPTCDSGTHLGLAAQIETGVPSRVYICLKDSTSAYEWVVLGQTSN